MSVSNGEWECATENAHLNEEIMRRIEVSVSGGVRRRQPQVHDRGPAIALLPATRQSKMNPRLFEIKAA